MKWFRSRGLPVWLVSLGLLGGLFVATTASAGQPRTHDGLLLRLSAGFGYASSSLDALYFPEFDLIADFEMSGVDGDLNLAIGGVVSPNLAIHGTLWGWSITDPDVEIAGLSGEFDGDMSMSAIGPGITYYFMPSNLYFSGSIGPAWLTWDVQGDDSDSDTGVAIDLTLGKEWWVGNSWGLGVAGCFGYHSIPDGGVDESWSGASLGLRFSATLN